MGHDAVGPWMHFYGGVSRFAEGLGMGCKTKCRTKESAKAFILKTGGRVAINSDEIDCKMSRYFQERDQKLNFKACLSLRCQLDIILIGVSHFITS